MPSFFAWFTGCSSDTPERVSNQYVSAPVPPGYVVLDNEPDDILVLDKVIDGLESILAIDHLPDLTIQPNAQTIRETTPVECLRGRLRSIEEDTKDPSCNWQKFRVSDAPEATQFQRYQAAEATFEVEENVNGTGRLVQRKIKRLVVFTDHDLWNIVLAPSEASRYEAEMHTFETVLSNLEIKGAP